MKMIKMSEAILKNTTEKQQIIEVIEEAIRLFGKSEKALSWLSETNSAMDDKIPLRLLKDETGRKLVSTRLAQISHGIYI
jgi:uncharacterized protein (DUF2384 family)